MGVSSVLSHVLCCVATAIILKPSGRLTHLGQRRAHGCFGGLHGKAAEFFGGSSGQREDTSYGRQNSNEVENSAE